MSLRIVLRLIKNFFANIIEKGTIPEEEKAKPPVAEVKKKRLRVAKKTLVSKIKLRKMASPTQASPTQASVKRVSKTPAR